jgi:peptidoglycan/xylan/chitin deacetylase (PgdA/CDA1 family)
MLAHRVVQRFKYEPLERRAELALQMFRESTGIAELPRLMMTRAMVAGLAQRGFEIGGHTIHHPILETMSDDDARQEIFACGRWIEEVTKQKPLSFAYPNGRPGKDFGPRHEKMVAEAGFTSSVSTEWSIADGTTNRYRIPRVGPWWRQGRALPLGLLRLYVGNRLQRR